MNLDDAQRKTVAGWISEGANLAAIQKRLMSELGVNRTYMQVRLLVDDLKLTPKDIERPRALVLGGKAAPASAPTATADPLANDEPAAVPAGPDGVTPPGGNVAVSVDQLARPGSVVSGKVTFSDGKSSDWYLDQMGRLGLAPAEKGYKPSAVDIQMFQMQLQNELAKIGF